MDRKAQFAAPGKALEGDAGEVFSADQNLIAAGRSAGIGAIGGSAGFQIADAVFVVTGGEILSLEAGGAPPQKLTVRTQGFQGGQRRGQTGDVAVDFIVGQEAVRAG